MNDYKSLVSIQNVHQYINPFLSRARASTISNHSPTGSTTTTTTTTATHSSVGNSNKNNNNTNNQTSTTPAPPTGVDSDPPHAVSILAGVLLNEADRIVDCYIVPGSSFEINISNQSRSKILSSLAKFHEQWDHINPYTQILHNPHPAKNAHPPPHFSSHDASLPAGGGGGGGGVSTIGSGTLISGSGGGRHNSVSSAATGAIQFLNNSPPFAPLSLPTGQPSHTIMCLPRLCPCHSQSRFCSHHRQ